MTEPFRIEIDGMANRIEDGAAARVDGPQADVPDQPSIEDRIDTLRQGPGQRLRDLAGKHDVEAVLPDPPYEGIGAVPDHRRMETSQFKSGRFGGNEERRAAVAPQK